MLLQRAEVLRPVVRPDGLDHLHADHGVILAGDGPVVAQFDRHLLGEAGCGHPGARQVELFLGERDRVHPGSPSGRPEREFAPAGADFE
jgi:hypothetical protein